MGRERKAPSEFVRDRGRGHGTCEYGIGTVVGSARRTIYNTSILQQRIRHKSEGESAPVQISGDKDRYPGPYERLVSRTVEHHGSAYSALRVANVVKVRVDQCDVTRVLLRGCGETEEPGSKGVLESQNVSVSRRANAVLRVECQGLLLACA